MRMTITTKLLGAVAVAGIVAATGSAFTGGGFSTASATGGFVGGSASQSATGATLVSSSYAVTANQIDSVTLVFGSDAAVVGKLPTAVLSDAVDGAAIGAYTCTTIAAVTFQSVCTADPANKAPNTIGALKITVPST
jgi:hypothetical protein